MNDPVNIAIETRANMFAWGQVRPKTNKNEQYEERNKQKAQGLPIQRLFLAEHSESEGSIVKAAQILQRAGDATHGTGKEETGRLSRSEKQQIIEKWAKDNNLWVDNIDAVLEDNFGSPINSGGEAIVYLGNDGKTVVKLISLDYYNNDVQEDLDRILIHNYLFGREARLSDIGFGRDKDGTFKILVEQPYIEGEFATHEEIVEYAKERGFSTEDGNVYYYNGIKINDLNSLNVIKMLNGGFAVIDAELRLVNENNEKPAGEEISSVEETDELPETSNTPIVLQESPRAILAREMSVKEIQNRVSMMARDFNAVA